MAQATEVIHIATLGLLERRALAPHDGSLSCDDVASLKLRAKLAVLSACNTARGELGADGVVGLARAFLLAGVPNVIVTLWHVSDYSTGVLMKLFYEKWMVDGTRLELADAYYRKAARQSPFQD